MRVAAHPRLYDPLTDEPALNGTVCAQCRHVYFPPIGIGCEICGAQEDQLQPTVLAAAGVLHAIAQVHLGSPLTIAEIVLDGGPLIRATIHPDAKQSPVIGDRVVARWSTVRRDDSGDNDDDVVEPCFVREEEMRQ